MVQIPTKRNDIALYLLSAGYYYADAGAAMGVLPYKLWCDKVELDDAHRIRLELHCLLIVSEGRVILVDCGIGEYLSEKLKKIYNPSKFTLLDELHAAGVNENDVNMVLFTHLHFDHVGGVINSKRELCFPEAGYLVQEDEWQTALNPNLVNKASYSLEEHYQILKNSDNVHRFEGCFGITGGIEVEHIGGHSPGMQIVKIKDDDQLIYFAGDAFPLRLHLNPVVTSAYDVCRESLCEAKTIIKDTLTKTGGKLILGHEPNDPVEIIGGIK